MALGDIWVYQEDSSGNQQRQACSQLGSRLFQITGQNLNATGDKIISGLPAKYVIDRLVIHDWSATPGALLAATLRDAATGGGNSLVGAIVGLNTPITATALAAEAFPQVAALGANRVLTASTLYFNVSVANGSALTANISLYILKL